MAFHRTVGIDIVVDSAAAERGFSRVASSANHFDKQLSNSQRGVTAAAGAFKHLGTTLVGLGVGYLGFQAVTSFIESSVTAAVASEKAQRSLAAQLAVSGASFKAWQSRIEDSSGGLAKFGFTTTDAEQSLTVLDRATGNIAVALKLQGAAADIARAKGIGLSQAALIVGKAYDGQLTSLKRLGVELPKGVTGMQAITIASQKFGGQAKANTTEIDKFHAVLHNTEIIIGTALLPVINRIITRLGAWLDRMNRSGKLQKDLNGLIKTGTSVFQGFKSVLDPVVSAFKELARFVGGTKEAVGLLVTLLLSAKVASALKVFSGLSAGGGVGGGLPVVGALAATDIVLGHKALTTDSTAGFFAGAKGSTFQKGSEQDDLFQAGLAGKTGVLHVANGGTINLKSGLSVEERKAYAAGLFARLKGQAAGIAGALHSGGDTGGSSHQPFGGSGNDPGHVQLPSSIGGTATFPRSRLGLPGSIGGEAPFRFGLGLGKLFRGTSSVSELRSLGLGKLFGGTQQGPLAAHFQLPFQTQLEEAHLTAVGNTAALTHLYERERASARAALSSGKLSQQAQIEAWDFIANINNQLAGQMSNFGPTGKVASSSALTAGIKFASVAQRREQEARIAQALSHGGHIPSSQSSQGIPITINLDGKTVAKVVTGHQQTSTRHRAVQTSGIHAGRQIP